MKMKLTNNKIKIALMTSIVFLFFTIITYLTPLAGDDWGYAINGMKGTPFLTAIEFYFSWSGRFLSELWGFLIAPNKWAWNILNPLFFTVIYICVNVLANPRKTWSGYLVTLFLMLYVSVNLRMETYTWIMGTTYVIPMVLCLIYLCLVQRMIKANRSFALWEIVLCCLLNFCAGLYMENLSAVMVLANVLLVGFLYFTKGNWKQIAAAGIFSLISLVIIRVSPGAAYRLSENTAWLNLSLPEKLWCNVGPFLRYTFYDNKYLIVVLNAMMCMKLVFDKKKKPFMMLVSFLLSGVSIFLLLCNLLSKFGFSMLQFFLEYETNSLCMVLNLLFWVVYIIWLFVYFWTQLTPDRRNMAIFILLLAGAANLVMFISPIFGSRSSFYFYFFAIILVLLVVDEINWNKGILILCILGCTALCLLKGTQLINKYRLVAATHVERLQIIEYYLDHPEEKDVWIPRMPIYTVHSADIEPEDTYHMDTFKKYYGLAEDCIIHFYWKE